MMSGKLLVLINLLLLIAAAGCANRQVTAAAPAPAPAPPPPAYPRQDVIADIKDFQKTLGFEEQGNFETYSNKERSIYRCYYTGKLELPESYDDLRVADGTVAGCELDEEQFDVFFYEMEAEASGKAPVTVALTEAPLERLLVVVPHEDFHNQTETERASPEIAEAAATLIGFLTAAEFAKSRYGPAAETSERLVREPDLFLRKARLINAYFDRVAGVYKEFREKRISRDDTLRQKAELFAGLERDCKAILPEPASFNRCPGAGNNAGLAFERTYARYYPMLYELSAARAQDVGATVGTLKQLLSARPRSEQELARAMAALPR